MDPITLALIAGGGMMAGGSALDFFIQRSATRRQLAEARKAREAQERQFEQLMAEMRRIEAENLARAERGQRANLRRFQESRALTAESGRVLQASFIRGSGGIRDVIEAQSRMAGAQLSQMAVQRGMAGSTVASTMQRGVQRDRARALGALELQRAELDAHSLREIAGLIERHQDIIPQIDAGTRAGLAGQAQGLAAQFQGQEMLARFARDMSLSNLGSQISQIGGSAMSLALQQMFMNQMMAQQGQQATALQGRTAQQPMTSQRTTTPFMSGGF